MGRRGTKNKPDWLKVVDGNPGKRAIGTGIVLDPVQEKIPAPEWFDSDQKMLWDNVCRILIGVRALTAADEQALIRYVELLSVYRKAADYMHHRASGNVVYPVTAPGPKDAEGKPTTIVKSIRMLPQLKAMLEISNHLLRIESLFGLNPSARASIQLNPKGGNDGGLDYDPFA